MFLYVKALQQGCRCRGVACGSLRSGADHQSQAGKAAHRAFRRRHWFQVRDHRRPTHAAVDFCFPCAPTADRHTARETTVRNSVLVALNAAHAASGFRERDHRIEKIASEYGLAHGSELEALGGVYAPGVARSAVVPSFSS